MRIHTGSTEGWPHFLDEGSGPCILLLHGFNGGAGLWAPHMSDLARSGYRCLAPDLPGWGDTPPPPGFSFTMPEAVKWLLRFLDRHAPGPVKVVGHSFGGAVALHLALRHPERVESLVLINSAGLTPKTTWHYRLLTIPGVGEYLLRPSPEKVRRDLPVSLVSDLGRVPAELLSYLDRVIMHPWFVRTSLNWVRRNGVLWRGAAAISVRDRLHELRTPTLLMVSELDTIVDPAYSVEASRIIPDARLSLFSGARHWLQLDQPEEFSRQLLAFFSENGQTALAQPPAAPHI